MDAVLDDAGFQTSLLAAVLLSVVVLVMARGDRDLRGAPAIAVLATLVRDSVALHLEFLLVVGLAFLAAGAWATRRGPFPLRSAAAASGAVLVALSLPEPMPTWAGFLVVAAIVALDPMIERFDSVRSAVGGAVPAGRRGRDLHLRPGNRRGAAPARWVRGGGAAGGVPASGAPTGRGERGPWSPRVDGGRGGIPANRFRRGRGRLCRRGRVRAGVGRGSRRDAVADRRSRRRPGRVLRAGAGFEESAWGAAGLTAIGYFSAAALVYATSR
jgi:hypothetical protein